MEIVYTKLEKKPVKIDTVYNMLKNSGCNTPSTIARIIEIKQTKILREGIFIGIVFGLLLGYLIPQ